MSGKLTPIIGDRAANPIYFSDGFYRAALVTSIALTVISASVGAMFFPLGSGGFFAMSLSSGIGFAVFVGLIIRGCIKTKQTKSSPNISETPRAPLGRRYSVGNIAADTGASRLHRTNSCPDFSKEGWLC